MNQYLLADENRDAIAAHNDTLIVTTTKTVGKASYTSHDFNREEEFRQLNRLFSDEHADHETVRSITAEIYGNDDDLLARRVRSYLRYGSTYQKTLPNGTARIARQDGTLRITRTADEYGDLVEENAARHIATVGKYVRQSTNRLNRNLAGAVDKVPELAERINHTREEAKTSLGSVFNRQLELLSGVD